MNCPRCQQSLAAGVRFCTSCGLSITASSDAPTIRANPADLSEISRDPNIGRVLEGKYELLAQLGSGGMGAVYRARRVLIGDEVAVKVLHGEYVKEPSALERFRREARAAALLHHPNVVSIYDYGDADSDGAPAFIVMELVSGSSLRKILDEAGTLSQERAILLMRSICSGVGAAHRKGSRLWNSQTARYDRRAGANANRNRHRHSLLHVAGAVPRGSAGSQIRCV